MRYIFFYGNQTAKSFGGQIDMLQNMANTKVIKLTYNHTAIFYKFFWAVICMMSLSKPQGFMFWGKGYKLVDNETGTEITNISFSQDDIVVCANQTLPKWLLNKAVVSKCKVIRWCDLTLQQLISQRYSLRGISKKKLISEENHLVAIAKCYFTNDLALQAYNNSPSPKDGEVLMRIVSSDFFRKKDFVNSIHIPFHLIFIGIDFERKRLDEIIEVFNKISAKHLVHLVVFGVDSCKVKEYKSDRMTFYGITPNKVIAETLCSISSNGFFNITATRAEGAPIVMLELQALGTICMCLDNSGSTSYLANKKYQFANPQESITEINKLILSPDSMNGEIERARRFVNNQTVHMVSKVLS